MIEQKSESTQINNGTLNKLRAAVLGANDGIVSTASVVMGVAGATDSKPAIITAGLAALVAGALSMAVGEYVSVSSQSDAEKSYIEKERAELEANPEEELDELTQAYIDEGVSPTTARKVAEELTEKDAMKAHLRMEFNLDEHDISSPTQAAIASLLSFTVGGLVPFLAVLFAPNDLRIFVTGVAVLVALIATGYLSAVAGGASRRRAVLRVVLGGLIAMGVTYLIGHLFGASIR
jgi:VIT1/CCC1 family predicted Fe2+/Mn2+ transporter